MPVPLFVPSSSAMTITFQDDTWTLDVEHITTRQAKEIYRFIGMPILRLFKRFGDVIKDSGSDEFEDSEELYDILTCLWWLARCQCGVREPLADTDMELLPFLTALMEAMLASTSGDQPGPAGADEPDPTRPSPPAGLPSPERPGPTATTPKRKTQVVKLPAEATA